MRPYIVYILYTEYYLQSKMVYKSNLIIIILDSYAEEKNPLTNIQNPHPYNLDEEISYI